MFATVAAPIALVQLSPTDLHGRPVFLPTSIRHVLGKQRIQQREQKPLVKHLHPMTEKKMVRSESQGIGASKKLPWLEKAALRSVELAGAELSKVRGCLGKPRFPNLWFDKSKFYAAAFSGMPVFRSARDFLKCPVVCHP